MLFDTTAQNPLGFNAGQTVTSTVRIVGNPVTKGELVHVEPHTNPPQAEQADQDDNEKILGVMLENAPAEGFYKVAICGRVQIKGTFTAGTAYGSGDNGAFEEAFAGGKVLALAAQTVTSGLAWAYFDGVRGLGVGTGTPP